MKHHKQFARVLGIAVIAAGAWVWLTSCTVTIEPGPDGGGSASFTIGGKTITLTLGVAGVFDLTTASVVQKIVDAANFLGGTPTDTPSSGTLRLRASSVTLRESTSSKLPVTSQTITGTARLKVAVDSAGATDPCQTGSSVGTYEIQVGENGVITIVDEELALDVTALNLFLTNDISMCLEMTSDFAGVLEIGGLDVIFGPSEDEPNDGLTARFTLINADATRVHIVAPGDEADEDNLVTPGMHGQKYFDNLSMNDLVTFQAVYCPNYTDLITGIDGTGTDAASCTEPDVLDTATCPAINQSDFQAVVLWYDDELVCGYFDFSGEDKQGCCLPDGSCLDMTSSSCSDLQGVAAGADKLCADTECKGACCLPGVCFIDDDTGRMRCGSCESMTVADCEWEGGTYEGLGVACDPWPCWQSEDLTADVYACCLPATATAGPDCADAPLEFCVEVGGDPQSSGVFCDDRPCPEACCFPDGTCLDLAPDVCATGGDVMGELAGTPGGVGTQCATTECLGACCTPNGCCEETTVDECDVNDGEYQGFDVDCDSDTCPEMYTCYTIVNFPEPSRYLTVQDACDTIDSGMLLSEFPGGGTDPDEPALFSDDVLSGQVFATAEEAAAACCVGLTDFTDDPAFMVTATLDGVEHGLDDIIYDECEVLGACCTSDGECTEASREDCEELDTTSLGPTDFMGPATSCDDVTCTPVTPTTEYVVWYTSNVCCWGAPHIQITDRDRFEAEELRSSWSGGGIDPTELLTKAELQGGFDSVEEAQEWLCPQFTSWSYHYWCYRHYQGPLGGNWQGVAGCTFDTDLPQTDSPPEFDGCQ